MFEKLEAIKKRYEELSAEISKSEVIANQELWRKLMKEHADLEEIVQAYEAYLSLQTELSDVREMAKSAEDAELREMHRRRALPWRKSCKRPRKRSSFCLSQKIPTMGKMSFWKFARERAARRPLYLERTCCACISAMQSAMA